MRGLRFVVPLILGGLSAASALAGTLVPIPSYPGSTATYVRAINDNNVIAGYYQSSDGSFHGFFGTLDGSYTSFDASANGTIPLGIGNDGTIVGTSNPTAGCEVSGCGFIRYPDGTIKTIHKGKKTLDAVVQGIIDQTFVGDYAVDGAAPNVAPSFYGFYGKGSSYQSKITLPFTTKQTRPRGFNRKGTVVGFYNEVGNGTFPGFVLDKNGEATSIAYPDDNAWQVYLEAINDADLIVGSWVDYALTSEHPFLFDLRKSAFSPIKVPHATYVLANGINNAGVVVLAADESSYIYCTKKKTCPLSGPKVREIPDTWVSARPARSIPIK